jgi:lysophospholipase L1-like esterase
MYKKYLLVFTCVYPILHLIACVAVFGICSSTVPIHGGRIPDMRLLPHQVQQAAIRSFLLRVKEQSGRATFVMVSGDSQIYGHNLPSNETVAAALGDALTGASVINVAKLGATYSWVRHNLEAALAEGITPDILVFNANPSINEVPQDQPQTTPGSFFLALVLTRETTAAFFTILVEDFSFTKARQIAQGVFQVVNLPRSFFPGSLSPKVEAEFRSVLELSTLNVAQTVVILGPHYYEPYNRAPYYYAWDTGAVVKRYRQICESYGHTICLDVATTFGRGYFVDPVHLNRDGHRALGAAVANALRSAGGPNSPPKARTH